jgi:hypothetical protein
MQAQTSMWQASYSIRIHCCPAFASIAIKPSTNPSDFQWAQPALPFKLELPITSGFKVHSGHYQPSHCDACLPCHWHPDSGSPRRVNCTGCKNPPTRVALGSGSCSSPTAALRQSRSGRQPVPTMLQKSLAKCSIKLLYSLIRRTWELGGNPAAGPGGTGYGDLTRSV